MTGGFVVQCYLHSIMSGPGEQQFCFTFPMTLACTKIVKCKNFTHTFLFEYQVFTFDAFK